MHIFGGMGFLSVITGVIINGYLFIERFFYNIGIMDRPLFIIGFFLIVIGIQFIALGILADILLKIYYGQNNRKNYLIDKMLK
jgi:hypothetical protein